MDRRRFLRAAMSAVALGPGALASNSEPEVSGVLPLELPDPTDKIYDKVRAFYDYGEPETEGLSWEKKGEYARNITHHIMENAQPTLVDDVVNAGVSTAAAKGLNHRSYASRFENFSIDGLGVNFAVNAMRTVGSGGVDPDVLRENKFPEKYIHNLNSEVFDMIQNVRDMFKYGLSSAVVHAADAGVAMHKNGDPPEPDAHDL